MNSAYNVTIEFTGSVTYLVEAKDEDEAGEMALDRLSAEPPEPLVDCLGEPQIASIEQEEQERAAVGYKG